MPPRSSTRLAALDLINDEPLPGGLGRPTTTGEWWSISAEQWREMKKHRKAASAHAGNIMEGGNGVLASNRCVRYVNPLFFDLANVYRCRKTDHECWVYSEAFLAQHSGQYSGRMKYGSGCARCRKAGKACRPGPEMDEDLQDTAANLQRENRRLRREIESTKAYTTTAAAPPITTTTTTITNPIGLENAIIRDLQSQLAKALEERDLAEECIGLNHKEIAVSREEIEELKEQIAEQVLDLEHVRSQLRTQAIEDENEHEI